VLAYGHQMPGASPLTVALTWHILRQRGLVQTVLGALLSATGLGGEG
jgi:hypothetical protein